MVRHSIKQGELKDTCPHYCAGSSQPVQRITHESDTSWTLQVDSLRQGIMVHTRFTRDAVIDGGDPVAGDCGTSPAFTPIDFIGADAYYRIAQFQRLTQYFPAIFMQSP